MVGRARGDPHAWRVPIAEIKARGYNLDIKNPHDDGEALGDPVTLLAAYEREAAAAQTARTGLREALAAALRETGALDG